MSPLEQEQLLEQTRAQIRQQVAEIAELARTSRHGAQFFQEFITRLVKAMSAQGGAVWTPGDAGECQLVAEANFASSAYHENERQRRDVQRVLTETFRNRRPFILGAGGPDMAPAPPDVSADEATMNATPYPMFFVPVLVGENQVSVIVQVWLRTAGDPKTYPTLVTFLNSVCVHASTFLKTRQGEVAMARNQEYEHMLRFLGDFVGELDPVKVGRGAVNHFMDLFAANRVSLFHQAGGRWRLEVVSNQETIDQRSELVGHACALAARLPVSDAPGAISLDAPEQAAEWTRTLDPLGARQVAYAFFQGHPHEGPTYLIVLERHAANAPFTPVVLRQLGWARTQLGKALVAASTYREAPFRRVLRPMVHARGMWKRRQRVRLAAWVGIPLALLALWLLIPWNLRVDGDCTVLPAHMVTVAAQTNGKIEKVFVKEGDKVERGALLARLEDEDLRSQMAIAFTDMSRCQAEANRFQAAGDDAQRTVAQIEVKNAQARIDRLKFLQTHTELRAPMDGVVLTKNLENRVGEALEIGKPFCEIAGRDAYILDIDVDQQDLGVVLAALRQKAELPVDYILHAHTSTRLRTAIHGADAISETAHVKPGGSFFSVRTAVPADSVLTTSLKAGYTGRAKINLGRQPLAAVMMRKFLNYWRVQWGF